MLSYCVTKYPVTRCQLGIEPYDEIGSGTVIFSFERLALCRDCMAISNDAVQPARKRN